MNTATALELSPAELELIEARRAEAAAKAETKRLEEEAKEAKALRIAAEAEAKITSLKTALRAADTKDVLFDNGDGTLRFLVGGREENVDISEHRVSSYNSWRSSPRGLKYGLRCGFNNYSSRMMSNPKTVMKNIYEAQEAAQSKLDIKKSKASKSVTALEHLTKKYPNAEVTFEQGHDYRGTRRYNSRDYAPDRVKVKTDNGHVEFTYTIDSKTNVIETSIWTRSIGKSITDKVNDLILG